MKITPIDNVPDLFLIEDILPTSLIEEISLEKLWKYNWEEQQMQTGWNRRKLLPNDQSPLSHIDNYYNQALDNIEKHVAITFEHKACWSSFWMDYEGFNCAVHEDGAERNYNPLMAMQIYLLDGDTELGTVFYHDSQGQHVRYAFAYKPNTGYLMLNHPGQWHGMTKTLPANKLRLSSYTYFGKFNHK
jgi:hypothetical protein